ncbi:hypothetical protein FRC06_010904, partial [Ceratobasidium sp. 370]
MTKLPSKVHMPGWQKDHAKAVQEMSGYTIDASPEDDVEDEDEDGKDNVSNSGAANNGGRKGDEENINAPAVTGNNNSTKQSHDVPDAPTGRILVPVTQETGGSGGLPGEPGGWSSSATVGASGSTSGWVEQSGWDRPATTLEPLITFKANHFSIITTFVVHSDELYIVGLTLAQEAIHTGFPLGN